MKKLRKLLTVMLAVLVLMTALPMTAVSALGEYELTTSAPYEISVDSEGERVKFVPKKDGWYKFYSTGEYDTYATLYNALGMELDYADDSDDGYNFSLKSKLSAGRTYYLDVCAYMPDGDLYTFNLYVEEAVYAKSAVITKEPDTPTIIEDYEYDTMFFEGLEAEFTMSDGTKYMWTYENNDLVDGSWVYVDYDVDKDDNYYVEISCDDASARFIFTVVENTVDHIVYNGNAIEFYENTNGFYDEDTACYYYHYKLPEDATVTVYYKDGSHITGSVFEKLKESFVYDYDNQYEEPWTAGAENYVYLDYLGAETQVPVNILPCPIENVTINSMPKDSYVFGDITWGYTDDGTYLLYPEDMTGINLTVQFKDGTTKTYTEEDFDTYNYLLDGYTFEVSPVVADTTGTYQVEINYKGYLINYEIEVIDSPVAGIEFLSDPDKTEYEGYYYPVFDGMELKLTYTDGTSETVTLSDENTEYLYPAFLTYAFTVGEHTVYAEYNFNGDMGEYYTFSCYETEADYTGFTFTYNKEAEEISVSKLTENGDGTVVNVKYDDGTEETLTLNTLVNDTYEGGETDGYAMTENGITYFEIHPEYEGEELLGYNFYFLGTETYIEAALPSDGNILGDANEDNEVNIKDATAIQKHIAKLAELSDTALLLADTDADEDVNIKDATAIQKHIAGIDTNYPIGERLN